MWIHAAATAPAAPPASRPSNPLTGNLVAGETPKAPPPAPAVEAPTLFRIGTGFMGGFFLAWAFKRFLKWTLLIGGAIAVAIAVLKGTGMINLDWASVEQQVDAGLAEAHKHAGAAREFVVQYLPWGTASLVGLFVGARRA